MEDNVGVAAPKEKVSIAATKEKVTNAATKGGKAFMSLVHKAKLPPEVLYLTRPCCSVSFAYRGPASVSSSVRMGITMLPEAKCFVRKGARDYTLVSSRM